MSTPDTTSPTNPRSTEEGGKVWFITGASRGFGRAWATAALQRGDRVVATARDAASVRDLAHTFGDRALPISLDVTDRTAVFGAVAQAVEHFGRLDVVVGNAGYGLFGALEETTEAAARDQIEVNVFGATWLLQAIAPVLRAQGSGRVLLTSSFGGLVSFPTAALYGASKYAVEGLGESFALEMADFGVHLTLIEPAAYATDFMGTSAQTSPIPAYNGARGRVGDFFAQMPPGDPAHTAGPVLEVVDMAQPPLRLLLGAHVLPVVLDTYQDRIRTWQDQQALANAAQ